MQISEWAAAVFCWFALGFILLIKALAWDGVRGQRGLTSLLRLAMSFGAVAVSVVLVIAMVECRACSIAAGGDRGVRHAPPECELSCASCSKQAGGSHDYDCPEAQE